MSRSKASADQMEKWLPLLPGAVVAFAALMVVLTGGFDWAAIWWSSRISGLIGAEMAIGPGVARAVFAALVIAAVAMAAGCCARAREVIVVLITGTLCAIVLAVALPMLGLFVEPLSATIGILLAGLLVLGFFRRPKGPRRKLVEAVFDRKASMKSVEAWKKRRELLPWKPQNRETAVIGFRILNSRTLAAEMAEADFLALTRFLLRKAEAIVLAEGGFVHEKSGDSFNVVYGFEPRDGAVGVAIHAAEAWRSLEKKTLQECENRWGAKPTCGVGIACGQSLATIEDQSVRLVSDVPESAERFAKLNPRFGSTVLLDSASREAAGEAIAVRGLDFPGRAGKWITGEVFELLGFASQLSEEENASCEAFVLAMEHLRAGDESSARAAFVEARISGRIDPVIERMIAGMDTT